MSALDRPHDREYAEQPRIPGLASRFVERRNLFALAILGSLGLFLGAKAHVRSPTSNDALYLYGVAVTSIVVLQMAVAFGRYKDHAAAAIAALDMPGWDWRKAGPEVACLVAVHNDEHIIADCVRALCRQTYVKRRVIVVDDASTDGTLCVLRGLQRDLDFTVLSLPRNVGKKAALAEAAQLSTAPIIAFTDSDSLWAPDALDPMEAE